MSICINIIFRLIKSIFLLVVISAFKVVLSLLISTFKRLSVVDSVNVFIELELPVTLFSEILICPLSEDDVTSGMKDDDE